MKNIKLSLIITTAAILLSCSVFGASFSKSRTYSNNFRDVPAAEWYGDSVKQVYELALMEGVAADRFDTESEMSVAQAITIAARLHSIYNGTTPPNTISGVNWYSEFVAYCKNNGIIKDGQFDNYNRSVLSYEMVQLFAAALPKEYFPPINDITYIQDVPENAPFADDVFLFYKAGILNGNDSYGTFLPMSAITRKRAAVILSRTVLAEKRLSYTLSAKRESYSVSEALSIIDSQTQKDTLDGISLITAGNCNVSAAEYRYYSYLAQGNKEKIDDQIKSTTSILNNAVNSKLRISHQALCDILSFYYTARIENYGTLTYFEALESQKLTDSVYAKLIAINDINYYGLKNEAELLSADDVYNYAVSNDYICAKHILIQNTTPDAYKVALGVRLELAEGKDFDELIAKYGQDPGMKARSGGYYFTYGWMVKEFETASYALSENDISGIVESDFGYHIIKRLPVTKEELTASPDYATISANAGSESYYAKLSEIINNIAFVYADNFDSIVNIL